MAQHSQYIATPRGGQWCVEVGQILSFGFRIGGLGFYPVGEAFYAGSNGSVIYDIQALPMGTNTVSITAIFWISNPSTGDYRFLGSQSLGGSTAPSPGNQYNTPGGGGLSCRNVLPVTLFPTSNVAPSTPVRMLYLNPGWRMCAASEQGGSGGPGWQINFYGGDW
jgi:hypothetical protein